MILLVYGDNKKFFLKKILKKTDTSIEVRYESNASQIHEYLALYRKDIYGLIIKKGMPNTSVMIGECRENTPRIPIWVTNGKNLEEFLN